MGSGISNEAVFLKCKPKMKIMTISIVDGRWEFSGLDNLPTVIDAFINSHRVVKPQRQRGRISKEHNYKFKSRESEYMQPL